MPELPEVETVRLGLEPEMTGKIIANADVRRPDLRWPFPKNMAGQLTGAKVLRLRRRSKYILCDLASGLSLLIHLGMSGRMTIAKPEQGGGDILGNFHRLHPTPEKHDHVVLDMETGVRITFNDARRFGAMDLIPTSAIEQHKLITILGPEPFGNDFNDVYLFEKIKNKKSPIKTVLLDQSIVAGLGNIYVCEVLWRAGISPTKLAGSLSKPKVASLVPIIREVLEEAIEAGGSSLKDHRQANGELGYFQHSFTVYGRENEECRTHNCASLIKRIVQSGRSTFFCSKCQK